MQNGSVLNSYSENVQVAKGKDQHRRKYGLKVAFKFMAN
jgi:hypothetical protein